MPGILGAGGSGAGEGGEAGLGTDTLRSLTVPKSGGEGADRSGGRSGGRRSATEDADRAELRSGARLIGMGGDFSTDQSPHSIPTTSTGIAPNHRSSSRAAGPEGAGCAAGSGEGGGLRGSDETTAAGAAEKMSGPARRARPRESIPAAGFGAGFAASGPAAGGWAGSGAAACWASADSGSALAWACAFGWSVLAAGGAGDSAWGACRACSSSAQNAATLLGRALGSRCVARCSTCRSCRLAGRRCRSCVGPSSWSNIDRPKSTNISVRARPYTSAR